MVNGNPEMPPDTRTVLYSKIKELNDLLWEHRANRPDVEEWLENFTGSYADKKTEHSLALYLLSKFLYFGDKEVRALLRAMFQDLIRSPLTIEARQRIPGSNDFNGVHQEFLKQLNRTRFSAFGSPASSGTHIFYAFRQENELPGEAFQLVSQILTQPQDASDVRLRVSSIDRLIFIDDFCGTGEQVTRTGKNDICDIRRAATNSGCAIEIWYLTLLATEQGLVNLQSDGMFDRVESLSLLDETYKVFGNRSQYFADPPDGITKGMAQAIMMSYGASILPAAPSGFGDCQLLLGFRHNVPDNTLPIVWKESTHPSWHPIFKRM